MTNLKKILAGALALCLAGSMFASCGETTEGGDNGKTTTKAAANGGDEGGDEAESKDEGGETEKPADGKKETLNIWAFTEEVPSMVNKYIELHPEFGEKYEINTTIISTTENAYQPALDQALAGGGDDAQARGKHP